MAFHGIMVVRDEGDVIGEVIAHLVSWVDSLYVLDTGSTDGTWEVVREWEARDARVVALESLARPYHNGIRAEVFDAVRHEFSEGDWIARLDGDEFYHVPPPVFVRERVAPREGRVFGQMYDFVMSRAEVAAWERGEETLADRARPIQERRRRYLVQEFPEPRLFRYRRGMKWPWDRHMPWWAGLTAAARIPVRHYRWRDPVQAAARCALRREMRRAGANTGPHWELENWREWIANDEDPRLLTYDGTLADPGLRNHLDGGWRRGAQRVFYGSGLVRAADAVMPGFARSGGMLADGGSGA